MATKNKEEIKKASKNEKNKPAKNAKKSGDSSIKSYLKGVRSELNRVVWPSKEDVLNYTIVVIATLIFFGVLIYIVDTLIVPLFLAFSSLR
ncbi:MAG: preprotein translocase subunit SecE [Coriobacteriia bacterium]|nr:preprotein translocase subunit SecE [Coriobacteriia bacterium]